MRMLPCRPIHSTTCSASCVSPEAILISNAPLAPEIEVTAERYLMFTLYFASSSSHLPRIASRLPAANVMGLRNGSIPGSAITCLPF